MLKCNINNKIKSQKGFTVAELSIAILIMIILVALISTIFTNIYISFTESKRHSMAMLYATQIAEKTDKMLFEEVTEDNLLDDDINIQNGYNAQVLIKTNSAGTVKNINISINYIVGNNLRTVELQKTKTRDYLSIPNSPIIEEGMVPVRYVKDEPEGYWVIASSDSTNWYNYYTNEWANIMLLDELTTDTGVKVTDENKKDLVGEKIATTGSMFVWIPRYAYKITDNQTIEIEFLYGNTDNYLSITETEDSTELEDKTYVQKIESITKKDNGTYKVHPSFKNGINSNYTNGEWNAEITGFWVAKYPAGFQSSQITYTIYGEENYPTLTDVVYSNKNYTSYNESYSKNALGQNLSSATYSEQKLSYPVFKPLTYAYNLISIGDSYTISREIANATEFYGLNNEKIDSHMMKNSEWGAVAYLTYSKYGRNATNIVQNNKNLNNNNNNVKAVTGYAEEEPNGVLASSTNNMSGVFDLNGCVWERVTSYIASGASNLESYGTSYANNIVSSKFFTLYPYSTANNTSIENWRILKNSGKIYGDAITEISYEENSQIKNWQGNIQVYPNNTDNFPFFIRGNDYSENADGIFAFKATSGKANINEGFRVTLINK